MRTYLLLSVLLGCGILSAQSTTSATIQSGGLTREYILYVPASYTGATPVPLVFNFHGYSSDNSQQLFYGDFRPIADTADFLLVLPNGTIDNTGNHFWNTFLNGASVDDVGFVRDLLDTLEANYNIDPNRVYSTGMSNGGFMSYTLACELNERIAAIASVTGDMVTPALNTCHPPRPVPVMEIHGTADNVVPYDGSPGVVPIPTLLEAWVGLNHCNPTPAVTAVPNNSTTDGCTAEHYVYSGGTNGSSVEHYKIIGGGHTWPGTLFTIGVTNQDFKASQEIWRFFNQYRLDQLSATGEAQEGAGSWSISPNPAGDYFLLETGRQGAVPVRIEIRNAIGQRIKTIVPAPGEQSIRVSTGSWTAGLYLVTIASRRKTTTLRLLKEAQ